MASPKTQPTDKSVTEFLNALPDETKRQDSFTLLELFKQITGAEPVMWGSSIIGFGNYHYAYPTGTSGDWPITGFSPRKQSLTLYILTGFPNQEELLQMLGKHSTGKVCLYIKRLSDVDQTVLRELVQRSVDHFRNSAA